VTMFTIIMKLER